MKKYISFFILSASLSMSGIVVSENMLPPVGPYRSYEVDTNEKVSDNMQKSLNRHQAEINRILELKNKHNLEHNTHQSKARIDITHADRRHADIPEWVRKNQQVMNRFNARPPARPPAQPWGQPPVQWMPNNQPAKRVPNQAVRPQQRQQPIQENLNTVRPYYPMSRDTFNGSNVPPAARYNYPMQHLQPNYQMQQPMNQYQPMWR